MAFKIAPIRREGYELFHNGIIELSQIETNGIRIDLNLLRKTKEDCINRLRSMRSEIHEMEEWSAWRKRYGSNANIGSRKQIATILHVDLEYEISDYTESGEASTDAEALSKIGTPFSAKLSEYLKLKQALHTFIYGIENETVDGLLYCVFNLHTARTYRSSCVNPNFQNLPVRDKAISKLVRSLVIPRPGCVIVENDFKGIEVSAAACYHHDKNFIRYIEDKSTDMHRDMAAQIYMLRPEDVSKDTRYGAKNKFVFPQFYGSIWLNCAPQLWEWIEKGKLKNKAKDSNPDAIGLYEHLKKKGITELGNCSIEDEPKKGTFQHHVKKVERDFWDNRFKEYGQWKRDWYGQYIKRGYFDLHTGFRVEGTLDKRSVCNYPIQGSAFHCLLWCLTRINRELRRRKMRSKILGQIHDSLIADVPIEELQLYLSIVERITTIELREHWKWIIVPMEIEYEISPSEASGGNWHKKTEVKFRQGKFKHPDPEIDKWTEDPVKFIRVLDHYKEQQLKAA